MPGSDRVVTFSGQATVSIPPNALVLSDPVKLDVPRAADVAISIFLPKHAEGAGIHYSAEQTAYLGPGDTSAASIPASGDDNVVGISDGARRFGSGAGLDPSCVWRFHHRWRALDR